MIAVELADLLGGSIDVGSVSELTDLIATDVPGFAAATTEALQHTFDGIVCVGTLPPPTPRPFAVEERNSYDYRLVVSRKLYDQAVTTQKAPAIAQLAGTSAIHLHPLDLQRVGAAPGAQVKVTSKRTSIVLPVVADPSVVRGSAWVPFNQAGTSVGELIDASQPVTDVRVESF
jgi:anaerobic selenocysteine-containing dehydrogenase